MSQTKRDQEEIFISALKVGIVELRRSVNRDLEAADSPNLEAGELASIIGRLLRAQRYSPLLGKDLRIAESLHAAQGKYFKIVGLDKFPDPDPASSVLPFVHNFVTHRSYREYKLELAWSNQLRGNYGPFPRYAEKNIIDGKKSLLSLGEGDGQYIATLLKRRKKIMAGKPRKIGNIHALDAAYHPDERIYIAGDVTPFPGQPENPRTQPQQSFTNPITFNKANIEKFPSNYHGALFQEMNLVSKGAGRLLFDEIISGWSLSVVLGHGEKPESLLNRVLEHLKPHGVLRLWGVNRHTMNRLMPLLEKFHAERKIKNHNGRTFEASELLLRDFFSLIIQKGA